ncbi:DUF6311 domain-containing protein [Candidatus Pelagibacter sp.]|nr:DUF6311 domain-containing protein [Candidatus Pelagibacter sp.]
MQKLIIKEKIVLTLSLLIVFLFTLALLGLEKINPNYDTWLSNPDLLSYQLPWKYFKNDIWRFPIFLNPTYGLEFSTSIIYSDNVAILNIFFKLFKNFLNNNFQFYGLWIVICFLMQYFISFKIILHITKNFNYSIVSSFLFVLMPFFIERSLIHLSLAAHWIILLSILYVKIYDIKKVSKFYFLIILSLLVNLHLAINIIGFIFLYIFLNEKLKISLKILSIYSFLIIFILFIIGFFSIGIIDNIDFGYGYYKSNILTFFDPKGGILNLNWSSILPDIDFNVAGEKEGFGYLGLGGIILLFFSTLIVVIDKYYLKKNFNNYFIILLIFLLLSLSTNLSFGPYSILNIELNKYIFGLLSIVRSSGRFIWFVIYLILIFSIVTINYKFPKHNFLIITLIIIIQIIDITPGLKSSNKYFNKNKIFYNKKSDEIWSYAQQNFKYLRHSFPISSPDHLAEYSSILLDHQFGGTDIVYLSRADRIKITKSRYNLYDNFFGEKLDQNTAYIVSNNHIFDLYNIFFDSNHGFFLRDNTWLLLPNKKELMRKSDFDSVDNLDLTVKKFEKNIKINPSLYISNFGLGWYKSKSFWSEGKNSNIFFKLSDNDIKNSNKIVLTGNIFNYQKSRDHKFKFELNGQSIQSKITTINQMQNITLSFLNREILKSLNTLKIINYNTETRQSLKIAPDPRLLGIKLKYIKIE